MKLGAAGTKLIQDFESCRLKSYQDQKGIWTIGWGHTGPDVGPNQTCTQAQADQWFVEDTQTAVLAVMRSVDVAINQNQFDALVSFTFNVGAGSEGHSTLLKYLNGGQTAAAAAEFPKWENVHGRPDPGLLRRREAEQKLFLTPWQGPASAT